jgi:hypothetical protein
LFANRQQQQFGHGVRFETASRNGLTISTDDGKNSARSRARPAPRRLSQNRWSDFVSTVRIIRGPNFDRGSSNPPGSRYAFDPNPRTRAHLRSSPSVSARTASAPNVPRVATRPVGLLACARNLEILEAFELRLVKTRLLD